MLNGNKRILAFDFGTFSIKGLALSLQKGRIQLEAMESALFAGTPSEREKDEDFQYQMSSAFRDLASRLKVHSRRDRHIYTSLPTGHTGVKQIKTLKLDDEEMRSSLAFEARKHLPLKGDILLDYQVLNQKGDSRETLLVAASKKSVENHARMMKDVTTSRAVFDAPVLALINSVLLSQKAQADGPVMVVQIGATLTNLCFWSPVSGLMSRDIPFGGNGFTEEIKREFKLDWRGAEDRKLDKGVLVSAQNGGSGSGGELSLALAGTSESRSIENLSREIHRSIRFFGKEAGAQNLGNIWLTGGSVADDGIREYLQKELRVECKILDPFEGISTNKNLSDSEVCAFGQTMGLALRGVQDVFPNRLK